MNNFTLSYLNIGDYGSTTRQVFAFRSFGPAACNFILSPSSAKLTTTMAEIHDQFDTILILDFGSQVRSQCELFVVFDS